LQDEAKKKGLGRRPKLLTTPAAVGKFIDINSNLIEEYQLPPVSKKTKSSKKAN
jgi:hypothetical protein